jgi:hypothetical protein
VSRHTDFETSLSNVFDIAGKAWTHQKEDPGTDLKLETLSENLDELEQDFYTTDADVSELQTRLKTIRNGFLEIINERTPA